MGRGESICRFIRLWGEFMVRDILLLWPRSSARFQKAPTPSIMSGRRSEGSKFSHSFSSPQLPNSWNTLQASNVEFTLVFQPVSIAYGWMLVCTVNQTSIVYELQRELCNWCCLTHRATDWEKTKWPLRHITITVWTFLLYKQLWSRKMESIKYYSVTFRI